MATTLKANLIIPEVIGSLVDTKLTNKMVFLPIADNDDTLVGNPGDTIKFPAYAYIGDAATVGENGQIVPVALAQTTTSATVAKSAKAVQITDEAVLSGYGNPQDEGATQIAKSIDSKIDNDILAALETVSATRQFGTQTGMSADNVADALTVFGEDEDGIKAMFVAPADVATLRKDADYIKLGDMGQAMILSGAVGEIWGCQIIKTNKIAADTADGEFRRFIVQPGAIKMINKRGLLVEVEREAEYQRQTVYGTKHYTVYLYDESKVVMFRGFTALKTVTDITSVAGVGASNDTRLVIPNAAPVGFKWVYKLGSADVTNSAFGTALSGYTDWTSATTDIAASTSTKAHVCLVETASDKPVKQQNVTLTKKA